MTIIIKLKNTLYATIAAAGIYAATDYLFIPKENNITHYLTKQARLEQKMYERQEIINGEEITYDLNHTFSWTEDVVFKAGYRIERSDNNRIYSVVHEDKLLGINRGYGFPYVTDFYGFYEQGGKNTVTNIFTETNSQALEITDKSFNTWYAKEKNLSKENLSNLYILITQPCKDRYSLRNSLDNATISLSEFKWDTLKASFIIYKDQYTTFIKDFHIKNMGFICFDCTYPVDSVNKTLSSEKLLSEWFGDFIVKESIKSKEITNSEDYERAIDFKLLKPSRTSIITLPFTTLSKENKSFVRREYLNFLDSEIISSVSKDNDALLQKRYVEEQELKLKENNKKKQQETIKQEKVLSKEDSLNNEINDILKRK